MENISGNLKKISVDNQRLYCLPQIKTNSNIVTSALLMIIIWCISITLFLEILLRYIGDNASNVVFIVFEFFKVWQERILTNSYRVIERLSLEVK